MYIACASKKMTGGRTHLTYPKDSTALGEEIQKEYWKHGFACFRIPDVLPLPMIQTQYGRPRQSTSGQKQRRTVNTLHILREHGYIWTRYIFPSKAPLCTSHLMPEAPHHANLPTLNSSSLLCIMDILLCQLILPALAAVSERCAAAAT